MHWYRGRSIAFIAALALALAGCSSSDTAGLFDQPTTAPAAGWITQEMTAADPTRVSLRCAIPSFDADGVLAAVNYCTNWSPL